MGKSLPNLHTEQRIHLGTSQKKNKRKTEVEKPGRHSLILVAEDGEVLRWTGSVGCYVR